MQARPTLTPDNRRKMQKRFDDDLKLLGDWLGVHIDCGNFRTVTAAQPLEWQ